MSEKRSTCWVLPTRQLCLQNPSAAAGTASNGKSRARSLLATGFGLDFSEKRRGLLIDAWSKPLEMDWHVTDSHYLQQAIQA